MPPAPIRNGTRGAGRLGWHGTAWHGKARYGTAQHGTAQLQNHQTLPQPCGFRGCRAAGNAAGCPTKLLQAGKWECGRKKQIAGVCADSHVRGPRAGSSRRVKPVLCVFQGGTGRAACIYQELTYNLTYANSKTEEIASPPLGRGSTLSPRWLAEPQGGQNRE